ncbi:unnamed protein product [Cuscuta europaea]|uniref:Uncharacterized protein n=1 Tax=Cuscuta europaea TaxID=41803 RepID=A0A9P1DY60_CUSEU|nr:unnamed protein product [Cuscuta europaea]
MDGRNSGGKQPRNEEAERLIMRNNVQVDVDKLIGVMQGKLSESPKLLTKSAGRNKCCIFRAPGHFFSSGWKANTRPHQPRAVSIGPYHHGKRHLKMMQEHKWRFLERVVKRTREKKGVGLEEYIKVVRGLEEEARECYSEAITTLKGDDKFVEMLVLDGCFVVEFFRSFSGMYPFENDDPFRTMQWIGCSIRDDLLCLENQIPYIVLQRLFELTEIDTNRLFDGGPTSLDGMALNFFGISDKVETPQDFEALHLLNLVRKSLIPVPGSSSYKPHCLSMLLSGAGAELERAVKGLSRLNCFQRTAGEAGNIHCITKLRRSGIKLKLKEDESSFLRVEFKRGVIRMPLLILDDTRCAFLLNCVAFEQCHGESDKLVSEYAVFLDCLIDTHKDVDILCEAKVLQNCLATKDEVAAFVGKLSKAVTISSFEETYLSEVYAGVNAHYDNNLHIHLAEVKHKYFSSPWSFISLIAAIFLLVLTVVQTIFAILDFKNK